MRTPPRFLNPVFKLSCAWLVVGVHNAPISSAVAAASRCFLMLSIVNSSIRLRRNGYCTGMPIDSESPYSSRVTDNTNARPKRIGGAWTFCEPFSARGDFAHRLNPLSALAVGAKRAHSRPASAPRSLPGAVYAPTFTAP